MNQKGILSTLAFVLIAATASPAVADKGLSLPKLPISLLSDGIPEVGGADKSDDDEGQGDRSSDKEPVASRDNAPPPPGRVKTEKSTAKLPLPILDEQGRARTITGAAAPMETTSVDPSAITKQVVDVTPGVVEVQQIAIGHLNRIEAPFDNPQVRTVSNVEIKIIDRIIYVMTQDPGPLSMYITTPDESIAVSLALLAKKIPPRDMRLTLNQPAMPRGPAIGGAPNPMARKLEEAQPYVESLREIIATTAKGEIPQGYSFQELRAEYSVDIHYCQIEGLNIIPRQRLDGHNYIITVSQVQNPTVFMTEIDESLCYREGIVAVAAWPQVVLRPGEQTELIIVQRREVFKPSYSTPRRPSAIGG